MKTMWKRLIGIFCVLAISLSYVDISYASNGFFEKDGYVTSVDSEGWYGKHGDRCGCNSLGGHVENLCSYHNRGTNNRLKFDCLVNTCPGNIKPTTYPYGYGSGIYDAGTDSWYYGSGDPLGGGGADRGRVYFKYKVNHSDSLPDYQSELMPFDIKIDTTERQHTSYPVTIQNPNSSLPNYVDQLSESSIYLFGRVGGTSSSNKIFNTWTQPDNNDSVYRMMSEDPGNVGFASNHQIPTVDNSGSGDTTNKDLFPDKEIDDTNPEDQNYNEKNDPTREKDPRYEWIRTYHGDSKNYSVVKPSGGHGSNEFYIKFPIRLKRRGYKFDTSYYSTDKLVLGTVYPVAVTGQIHLGAMLTHYETIICLDTNSCGITNYGTDKVYRRDILCPVLIPIHYKQIYNKGKTNIGKVDQVQDCAFDLDYQYYPENTFTGRSYKIVADANGGKFSGNKDDKTITGNLPFKSWNQIGTLQDGENDPGSYFIALTKEDGKSLDVIAKWKTVTTDSLEIPKRDNYEFDGWELEGSKPDDTTVDTETGKVEIKPSTSNCTVKLKAKWKPMYKEVYILTAPKSCSTLKGIKGAGNEIKPEDAREKTYSEYGVRKWVNPDVKKQGSEQTLWKADDSDDNDKWIVPGYHFEPFTHRSKEKSGGWSSKSTLDTSVKSVGSFGVKYKTTDLLGSGTNDKKIRTKYSDLDWSSLSNSTKVKVDGSGPLTVWFYTTVVANKYTIKYEPNKPKNTFGYDVKGTVADQIGTFDKWLNLKSGGYSLVGYELVGWSSVEGSYEEQIKAAGNIIPTQKTLEVGTVENKKDFPKSINHKDKNGKKDYNKNLGLKLKVRNIGGWTSKYDSSKKKYVSSDNVTLYAIWKPITYKVVFTNGKSTTASTKGAKGSKRYSNSNNSLYGTSKYNADYTPMWGQYSYFFNNTPNLSATKVKKAKVNFTNKGYYIDYWKVKSITGTRDTSKDTTGKKYKTGTGYTSADKSTSKLKKFRNLCAPKKSDCVVTLEAHWAPLRYKVKYNNDTTTPVGGTAIDRGYKFSKETMTTKYREFGKSYSVDSFSPTRSNKYGKSVFLGYCFGNGDIGKTPTYIDTAKTKASYISINEFKKKYTASDWSSQDARIDARFKVVEGDTSKAKLVARGTKETQAHDPSTVKISTNKNLTYTKYFSYIQDGAIQSFSLYAVWDDCPGIEPIDVEQNREDSIRDYNSSRTDMGKLTRSGTDLEYRILMLDENRNSVWDREDDVKELVKLKGKNSRYYLDNFKHLGINKNNWVHNFELRYTLIDNNGNKYQTSRKLYDGYLHDIMLPIKHID